MVLLACSLCDGWCFATQAQSYGSPAERASTRSTDERRWWRPGAAAEERAAGAPAQSSASPGCPQAAVRSPVPFALRPKPQPQPLAQPSRTMQHNRNPIQLPPRSPSPPDTSALAAFPPLARSAAAGAPHAQAEHRLRWAAVPADMLARGCAGARVNMMQPAVSEVWTGA